MNIFRTLFPGFSAVLVVQLLKKSLEDGEPASNLQESELDADEDAVDEGGFAL